MRATDWEFKYRAMLFGQITGVCFALYAFDHRTSALALASLLERHFGWNGDLMARGILFAGAGLVAIAAFLRTWASSYLHADVVYAPQIKSEALVADGPYRLVRNPLYLANILMAVGMGSIMSRSGHVLYVLATSLFCLRLILREEAELGHSQGESYRRYCAAVPRLLPALTPRVPGSGRAANWLVGFKAEAWFWGFAVSATAFAITLRVSVFLVILAASLALFWFLSTVARRRNRFPDAAS